MKKNIITSLVSGITVSGLVLSGFMFQGCSNADLGSVDDTPALAGPFELTAVIGQTKTVFTPPFKVEWASDDALSVIVKDGNGYKPHRFVKTHSGDNTFGCEGFAPEGITEYNVLYPFEDGFTGIMSDGFTDASVRIGAEVSQAPLYGRAESLDNGTVVSMHHSSTLFEVKVLNVSDADIEVSQIRLSNNQSAPMNGMFSINPATGELKAAEASSEAVLDVVGGKIPSRSESSFYIVSAPFSLSDGDSLNISLTMLDGQQISYGKKMSGNAAFEAGKVNHTSISYPDGAVTDISFDRDLLEYDFSVNPDAAQDRLEATVLPSDAYDKTLIWTSSDPYVAKVSEDGVVTPVGHGKAVITATAKDGNGAKAECIVTVNGVKDLNYGKGDVYYDKIYYPVNIEVTLEDGTTSIQTWLDRNLGASEVASASNHPAGYGSLFQWSRKADGHEQVKWTSASKGAFVNKETVRDNRAIDRENPGTNKFIYLTKGSHYDWVEDPKSDMEGLWGGGCKWGGVDQTHVSPLGGKSQANNPCPEGYRLPSAQEVYLMVGAMSGLDVADNVKMQIDGIAAKLLESPMHIPAPGYGNEDTGNIASINECCVLWCNAPGAVNKAGKYETSRRVFFSATMTSNNLQTGTYRRARGGSVRCIRDKALDSVESGVQAMN